MCYVWMWNMFHFSPQVDLHTIPVHCNYFIIRPKVLWRQGMCFTHCCLLFRWIMKADALDFLVLIKVMILKRRTKSFNSSHQGHYILTEIKIFQSVLLKHRKNLLQFLLKTSFSSIYKCIVVIFFTVNEYWATFMK